MNIVDLVEKHSILVRSEAYTFIHGDEAYQNAVADRKKFPLVFLDEPIISNDEPKQSGYIEETYPVKIAFMWQSKMDWTPEQHQPLIDKAMADARAFVLRIMADSTNVGKVSNVKRVGFRNFLDANASGCFLFMNILKRNTDGVCPA